MRAVLVALLSIAALGIGGTLAYMIVFLPLTALQARLLPRPGRTTVDGVTTIADAVAACRATGLGGRALVDHARALVTRKMEYSRRNPWDSWSRCFERGMGYCVQQSMALRLLLSGLGIRSWPVQALRCGFPEHVVHGTVVPAGVSGHMWLRASVDGAVIDVRPGLDDFTVHSPVRRVPSWLVPVLHVLSAAENVRRDRRALLPVGARRA